MKVKNILWKAFLFGWIPAYAGMTGYKVEFRGYANVGSSPISNDALRASASCVLILILHPL
jgi:hypothetical protein